jgi:NADH:ubiquinone oxidoreductase subunit 5 (subunit L)/multisubunit Na+/H+ antiporter MnhA subunit
MGGFVPLSFEAYLLVFPSAALCAGALVQIALARWLSSRGKGIVALLSAMPALAGVFALLPLIREGRSIHISLQPWDGALSVVLHADALSALFACMGSVLGTLVLLYSIGYMRRDPAASRFYATMLVFIGGFVALVYCANLFLLYLCWEVIGLCSFSLVGFWFRNREAVEGARKVLLTTHIAGYGLLAGIVILYFRAGTALWTDPAIAHHFSTGVFLLMLVALVAKSVQFPLHTWIPDAMAAPTPVSSLLHAACYVTAGVYLAARMRSFGVWPVAWNAILITIASITMIVGVMYALVQSDLKRMLAFSTVSQIGYMLLGIGIGTPLGIMAGLLHCLNHGFFKGGLFLNAGAVQHAAGTRDMNRLGGLAQRMPRTTLCWLVGVGNMAGIPLMSGFVSKWMLYAAALQAGWAIPAVIAWIVSLGTVFLCAKATSAVFLGPPTEATRDAHEASPEMQWAMGLMACGSIVLGIAPQLAVPYFFHPMLAAFGLDTSLSVTWLGLFSGAGAYSTVGGLALAVVSFVLGAAVFGLARTSTAVPVRTTSGGGAILLGSPGAGVFTGGEPLWEQDHLTATDFSRIFEHNWQTFFRWSNVDRFYAFLFHGIRTSARVFAHRVAWLENHALALLFLFGAIVLALATQMGSLASFGERFPLPPTPELLTAAACIATVALVCAAAVASQDSLLPLLIAVPSAFAVTSGMAGSEWMRFALLECASLLSIFPVWKSTRKGTFRFVYPAVVIFSGICLGLSMSLSAVGHADWARACLFTSVCVKFAAVPFSFWLLRLADEVPGLVLALVVAVVDMTAVGELSLRAQVDPGLFTPAGPWLVIAVLTSMAAAVLMLAQRNIKRLLVLSSLEDVGFLMLGISSLSTLGRDGVMFAAASHVLGKSLLFVSIASPEHEGVLDSTDSGLAQYYPFSAFGFLIGMLAMLGIPPFFGFAGRWKLYETALRIHPALLAGFLLASIFALIAYVTTFVNVWWGTPHSPARHATTGSDGAEFYVPPLKRESIILKAAIVALCIFVVSAGLWPQMILEGLRGGRP